MKTTKKAIEPSRARMKSGPKPMSPEAKRAARAASVAKYQAKPDAFRYQYAVGLRHNYGIEVEDFARMLNAQGLKCAICSVALLLDKATQVDHCHATGRVRAVLCQRCNMGLGAADDSPERLRKMAAYIEAHR